MSTIIPHIVKRSFASMLAVAALAMLVAEPAAAHKYGHRPYVTNHYYYQHGRRVVFPRWLRKHRDFQRWYYRSDYRFIRGASWEGLYDLYRFERRYNRHGQRRFRGRVYVDPHYYHYKKRRW